MVLLASTSVRSFISVVVVNTVVESVRDRPRASADDRLTTPSSSAPSVVPGVQRKRGQIGLIRLHCHSGSHQARRHGHAFGNAAEIQHENVCFPRIRRHPVVPYSSTFSTALIALLKPSVNMMVATAASYARWGLTLQAGCRAYVNLESGRHVRELNRTVFNQHTVDTNFRGDIITISHRGGVGQDSAR